MTPPSRTPTPPSTRAVVLLGAESVGKSSLAAAMAGTPSRATNLAGSTLAVEVHRGRDRVVIDTPGLVHRIDTAASALALDAVRDDATVLLVLRATHVDDELTELLPVVEGHEGAVAVTHLDRLPDPATVRRKLTVLGTELGVPVVALDARAPGAELALLDHALRSPGRFAATTVAARFGPAVEPPAGAFDHPLVGPLLGSATLLGAPAAAVWAAVSVADRVEPVVEAATASVVAAARTWPDLARDVIAGDYGLVTMGPLLLVWALPVVVALALLLGVGSASGVLDRVTVAVHPLVRPFGLTGRDLVRVVAGHGCNVPAVLATRSCSSCTRDATIGAIAIGASCSYQLAATLGVLAAARRPALVLPYLAILLTGALVHARLIGRRRGVTADHLDLHLLRGRGSLRWPRAAEVRREARTTLTHVTLRALPVFLAITVAASVLASVGALDAVAGALTPVLGALRLPVDTALPIALASVRKDGLLLLAEPGTVAALDAAQLLAALVLASALVPCLVTAATIVRERGARTAGRLLARQAALALLVAAAISWGGLLVVGR